MQIQKKVGSSLVVEFKTPIEKFDVSTKRFDDLKYYFVKEKNYTPDTSCNYDSCLLKKRMSTIKIQRLFKHGDYGVFVFINPNPFQ